MTRAGIVAVMLVGALGGSAGASAPEKVYYEMPYG